MPKEETKKEETKIEVNQSEWQAIQKKLQMLEEVADKGRILNWQTKQSPIKQPITVKVSVYDGKYIVGWKTLKFELGRNPTTGRAIWGGEVAEYELFLVDKEGVESTEKIQGYSLFSDIKYNERVECPVVAKKETANGELLFEVQLPGGKTVTLEDKFLN